MISQVKLTRYICRAQWDARSQHFWHSQDPGAVGCSPPRAGRRRRRLPAIYKVRRKCRQFSTRSQPFHLMFTDFQHFTIHQHTVIYNIIFPYMSSISTCFNSESIRSTCHLHSFLHPPGGRSRSHGFRDIHGDRQGAAEGVHIMRTHQVGDIHLAMVIGVETM